MLDIGPLTAWIGRQETASETLAPFPAAALTASLDRDDPPAQGDGLPPLWHWIYFHELPKASALAENGHATLGEFMPPVPLPRRMIAGGRLTFQRPLRVGQPAQRISTVADLKAKRGGSGDLAFLLLRHEFAGPDGTAIVEEQDIVYREAPRPGQAAAASRRIADKPVWKWETPTNEALLFRYSALLFNAHRIHYDRPYCEAQGYPGLIVHGPLIATLLADLVRRNTDAAMTEFRFRAVSPLFNGSPCVACGVPEGNHVRLWAQDGEGGLVMEAEATLAG
jgi:3-methylfumaryl-CoA hydratase